MELFDALLNRYSFRGYYQDAPVPREDLRKIMEAGLSAPSGCNKQTTSLIAVDDKALLASIADLMQKPTYASAPAAVCVLTKRIVAYRDRTYYVQDYAAAIENMLLAITALGYASCWIEGYITDEDRIGRRMADVLSVPEDMELVAFLPVGIPKKESPRAKKLPFEQRAWFNGYQNL